MFSEITQAIKFGFIPRLIPQCMILILFAMMGIPAGSLQMSVVLTAYPYIFPGRRNHKAFNPLKSDLITDEFLILGVNKFFSFSFAFNPALRICDVNQMNCFCKFSGITLKPANLS